MDELKDRREQISAAMNAVVDRAIVRSSRYGDGGMATTLQRTDDASTRFILPDRIVVTGSLDAARWVADTLSAHFAGCDGFYVVEDDGEANGATVEPTEPDVAFLQRMYDHAVRRARFASEDVLATAEQAFSKDLKRLVELALRSTALTTDEVAFAASTPICPQCPHRHLFHELEEDRSFAGFTVRCTLPTCPCRGVEGHDFAWVLGAGPESGM